MEKTCWLWWLQWLYELRRMLQCHSKSTFAHPCIEINSSGFYHIFYFPLLNNWFQSSFSCWSWRLQYKFLNVCKSCHLFGSQALWVGTENFLCRMERSHGTHWTDCSWPASSTPSSVTLLWASVSLLYSGEQGLHYRKVVWVEWTMWKALCSAQRVSISTSF